MGAGRLWITGHIVTRRDDAPCDASVLILPDDWNRLLDLDEQERGQLYSLLTLQDVVVGPPIYLGLEHVKPVASMLDGFLCFPGHEDDWHETWSAVKGHDGQVFEGIEKGYVEVSL